MRLAIIDYKNSAGGLKNILSMRGIDVDIASSLNEFEHSYGRIGFYNGILLHLDIKEWRDTLNKIPKLYPDLKYAIATHGLGEYLDDSDANVFDFSDSEGIYNYFFAI